MAENEFGFCDIVADLKKPRANFTKAMIDGILAQLRGFNDRTLRKDIEKKPAEVAKLVKEYFYCG